MRNYLMLLGWAPSGDREIVPWSVIEEEFRLEDVNPSPAFFDERKLRAFNGEYIRALSVEDFIDACQPWLTGEVGGVRLAPWAPEDYDPAAFAAVAPLAQTRIALLSEIVPNVDFLFLPEPTIDQAAWDKAMKEGSADLLAAAIDAFAAVPAWEAEALQLGARGGGCRAGPQARQGPGAGTGGGHRARRGSAALRVAGGARPGPHPGPAALGARARKIDAATTPPGNITRVKYVLE